MLLYFEQQPIASEEVAMEMIYNTQDFLEAFLKSQRLTIRFDLQKSAGTFELQHCLNMVESVFKVALLGMKE